MRIVQHVIPAKAGTPAEVHAGVRARRASPLLVSFRPEIPAFFGMTGEGQ